MLEYPVFSPNEDDFYRLTSDCKFISPYNFSKSYNKFFIDSCFSMLHLNIRSCRQNFALFHVFLNSIFNSFSIIALTETWLSKDIDILFELDSYNSFAQYRNRHGGGIKVFIRSAINVNVLDEFCTTTEVYESFVCEVFLCNVKYIFCCIYRPPSSSIRDFNIAVENDLFNKLKAPCGETISSYRIFF